MSGNSEDWFGPTNEASTVKLVQFQIKDEFHTPEIKVRKGKCIRLNAMKIYEGLEEQLYSLLVSAMQMSDQNLPWAIGADEWSKFALGNRCR